MKFPLIHLFIAGGILPNINNKLRNPTNKREVVKYAFYTASVKFQKKFNVRRSYTENNGDVDLLSKDVICIFWALYREEFPSLSQIKNTPKKYTTSVRENFNKHHHLIALQKCKEYKEDRLRGAEKRYNKEQDIRGKWGDGEFNRRMVPDKAVKHSKGADTDTKYLKYLEWRKAEMAKSTSPYFSLSHAESSNVRTAEKYPYLTIRENIPIHSFKIVDKNELCLVLLQLLQKNIPMYINIKEAGFGNYSMQYAWSINNILSVDGTKRTSERYGAVHKYAYHPTYGLLIAFDNKQIGYHILFPKEYRRFTDYRDPVTDQFVGNPKNKVYCHTLHSVNGTINVSIKLSNGIINLTTDGNVVAKTRSEMMTLIAYFENPTDSKQTLGL